MSYGYSFQIFEEEIFEALEPLGEYRRGGYHPVELNQMIEKYHVVNKLGFGKTATVWLVENTLTKNLYAMKIFVAARHNTNGFQREYEASIRFLYPSVLRHPGKDHLLPARDFLTIEGLNGTHDCMVIDIVYKSVVQGRPGVPQPFPARVAKMIVRQVLLGLDCLHKNGMIHGNLRPGNIDLAFLKTESILRERVASPITQSTPHTSQGHSLPQVIPRQRVKPMTFKENPELIQFKAKIRGLSQWFQGRIDPATRNPRFGYQVPEYVFGSEDEPIGPEVDIWSLACVMFELFTSYIVSENLSEQTNELIKDMLDTTGSVLPARWELSWSYMRSDTIETESERGKSLEQWLNEAVRDYDMDKEPDHINDYDLRNVLRILKSMLQIDPRLRPTATSILADPWFYTLS